MSPAVPGITTIGVRAVRTVEPDALLPGMVLAEGVVLAVTSSADHPVIAETALGPVVPTPGEPFEVYAALTAPLLTALLAVRS